MAGDRSPTPERRRGIRRLLLARGEAGSSSSSPPQPAEEGRRKGFASAALRGLGCASAAASQAYAPGSAAAVRSSADWHGRRRRGKGSKERRRKERGGGGGGGGGLVSGGIGADVWCAPGIPFAAEASSVDCVVARHQMVARGRGAGGEGERSHSHRERPCLSRRVTVQEQMTSSFMDSPPPPHLEVPFFGADLIPSGRLRRMRGYRHSPGGLEEEIMMFQTRVLLGGMSMYDRYQDWRLDVDNMTYEELLELEDRIGYVNTGLREDEITRCLRKVKAPILRFLPHPAVNAYPPSHITSQEEFEANEEMGRLDCGHSYHVYCIKQWLSQKNTCPVCKTAVTKT
ncbi:hypothetical protein PR202_ga10060 [Eleusine coracana subsp. coracana]|uniref:RING-type E3 ubiquitin transferase n=1 Tax=Eleusine coracana subsp. coracana TaxID=191504 RepID=A0AAV5C5S0_ELECO|nr:hypothetical protein PR202_ga10060 [Eleusine coracana subsp. coracana]